MGIDEEITSKSFVRQTDRQMTDKVLYRRSQSLKSKSPKAKQCVIAIKLLVQLDTVNRIQLAQENFSFSHFLLNLQFKTF